MLDQGDQPDQDEGEAHQPRDGTDAPIGQAEEPEPRGDDAGGGVGFQGGKIGNALGHTGHVELPAEQHERADGRREQGEDARHEQRYPRRTRRRQRHFRRNLSH